MHDFSGISLVMKRPKCAALKVVLTLKTPRKPASENVICLCRLLNILANFPNLFFSIQANSLDPDQTAPRGAV